MHILGLRLMGLIIESLIAYSRCDPNSLRSPISEPICPVPKDDIKAVIPPILIRITPGLDILFLKSANNEAAAIPT